MRNSLISSLIFQPITQASSPQAEIRCLSGFNEVLVNMVKIGYKSTKKQRSKILPIIFNAVFIAILTMFTQSVIAEDSKSAVWAWKISNNNRTVYLMGELHWLQSNQQLNIDYDFGMDLYKISSELWVEPKQANQDTSQPSIKMHDRVSRDVWEKIKIRSRTIAATILKNKSADEIDAFSNKMINEFDLNSPFGVYGNIKLSNKFVNIYLMRPLGFNYIGQKQYIISNESPNKLPPISYIEADDSVAVNWRKFCSRKENDILLEAALTDIDFDKEAEEVLMKEGAVLDDIENMLTKTEVGRVIKKCAVTPRNFEWISKILNAMNTKGQPIAVLVGLGHLSGKDGLIELLSTNKGLEMVRLR